MFAGLILITAVTATVIIGKARHAMFVLMTAENATVSPVHQLQNAIIIIVFTEPAGQVLITAETDTATQVTRHIIPAVLTVHVRLEKSLH